MHKFTELFGCKKSCVLQTGASTVLTRAYTKSKTNVDKCGELIGRNAVHLVSSMSPLFKSR